MLNVSVKGTYRSSRVSLLTHFIPGRLSNEFRGRYYDKNSYWVGMNRNGLAVKSEKFHTIRLFESTVRCNGDIAPSVSLNAVGGYSYQDFEYEGFYAQGGDFLTDAFTYNNLEAALDFKNGIGTITSYKNSNKLIAFFGLVNLNIKDTFFVTASARYEGSSRFGEDNKWGLFPAIGGGVDLARFINNDAINS